ncbi:hypothetical protein R70211_02190 [Paraburkholderia domus]|uniref:OmpR/PhoB-type domain-containing protein n=2 Tax=Paraburkholderia domus TaxID=2793075 RepID=A0A9N8MNE5_9BURK|nr:hypothetical protein R75483_02025 [Paraburkholderia domus]CAE6844612.1 hypothetical protein R70199_00036 [Paraburkholderia domus]CAE6882202.1 hypothetical protein R70211_02190 [Paraburkholderia domus]CAE6888718.1 hypothetical protein R75471_02247 [Paraburkholderia domus]
MDVLVLLVQANNAVVSKNDIMRAVWPDTVVEDSNVYVQVSAIETDRPATVGRIMFFDLPERD